MLIPSQTAWNFLAIWEFRVQPGKEKLFEEAYGRRGIWAQFFASGKGFVATELNRDLKDSGRYITLDYWVSKREYDEFRAQHAQRYSAIDAECEAWTAEEKLIGSFERL